MNTLMKFLLGAFICVALSMLYWSSLLIEERLKNIDKEISELKKGLKVLSKPKEQESNTKKITLGIPRDHIRADLPNLLKSDPYYEEILPKMLGSHFKPLGTRREAIVGRPQHLHPFNSFKDFASMISSCTGSLAKLHFGKYEIFAPYLALKIEKRVQEENDDAFEYWIHLRDDVFWEPLSEAHFSEDLKLSAHFLKRHPVTSHDYKFYFDAIMNPYVSEAKGAALRRAYADIESFNIIDDLTLVIRWKRDPQHKKIKYNAFNLTCALQPLPCFVFKYFADGKKIIEDDSAENIYRIHSIWAQNFSNHFAKNVIVSCGAECFAGMSEEGIRFVRNPNFFDPYASLSEEYYYVFKESPDAMWQDFKAEKIDFCLLSPHQWSDCQRFFNSNLYQEQSKKGMQIKDLKYVDPSYFYIGWNQKRSFFENKKMRQALSLLIDRKRIIDQNLNEMGIMISGPFAPYSPSSDPELEPWPYDPDKAVAFMEEEGWYDLDGDGVREKLIGEERIPFRFTLLYYVKNSSAKLICEYVSTSLKQYGIDCRLFGVDLPDLSRHFEDKSFDALLMGWSLGAPPEDPEQLWHSSLALEKGSSNAIGFCNKEVDEIIDKLHYEYDKKEREALYHRFHHIIHDEAPYTFLYAPKRRLLYREYVHNLFIPSEKKDIIPGAEIPDPQFNVIWVNHH